MINENIYFYFLKMSICDKKPCANNTYEVTIEDEQIIGQIRPIEKEVKNTDSMITPAFRFDRLDHYVATNIKHFMIESLKFRKSLRDGSLILTESVLDKFLHELLPECPNIQFIINNSSEAEGCCGYSTTGPRDLKIYINKLEFRKNYEEVFNQLLIDYSIDLDHII